MSRIMKWLLLTFLWSALFATGAQAKTITAADCQQTSVAAAVAQAVNGDTVVIPACPSGVSWTTTLTMSKSITIQGQGIGQTVLIDNVSKGNSSCGGGGPMLSVSSNTYFRLTGFTVQGSAPDTYICQPGHLVLSGTSQTFRVDNVAFTNQQTAAVVMHGNLWGVIDHCTFQGSHKQGVIVNNEGWGGASYGDGSWASPTNLGSSQFVFIEDNTFTDPSAVGAGAFDVEGGGRIVFRHNTANFVAGHGTESSGRRRGMRAFEIYNNTFTPVQNGQYTAIYLRSGTGVIYNNTFNDGGGNTYNSLIQGINFRDTQAYTPWGQCNGTSSYDQNTSGQSGYACIDQIGRGAGNLLSGDPPTPVAWPNQALEPVYQWGNTHNGVGNQTMVGMGSHITANRDFYDNVTMPGYTPYPYPHPLTLGSKTGPAPPTGLAALIN
jgi:hypothetical protein